MELEKLKYPVGKYQVPEVIDQAVITKWMDTLEELPKGLRKIVENLSYECLDWAYRPKGWTIKQVVHHLADSHMNCFSRFKLIMTEENPTVRPFDEASWADLPDANNPEVSTSLTILEGLHSRMNILLRDLIADDWNRTFFHPEYEKSFTLSWMIGLYAWHSTHHLAHIKQAIDKEGDFTWAD